MRLDFETKMKLAQTNLQSSRRDSLKIARRFNAGIGLHFASSPAGTAEPSRQIQSSLRDLNSFAAQPGVETPGYYHMSRWDKMNLAQVSLSKLKACNHSAQRWSAATTLVQRRNVFSTLNGLNHFCSRICLTPLQGAEFILDFTQGSAPLNPGLNDGNPSGCPEWRASRSLRKILFAGQKQFSRRECGPGVN